MLTDGANLQVVTMKFGTKYESEWVNRLFRAVSRNLTVPHDFVCFTDDHNGLAPQIHVEKRPDIGGWWNHLHIFSGWTDKKQMMIDVDDVVVGSLDELAIYGGYLINSDVYDPANVDGGFQIVPPHCHNKLYDMFMDDPKRIKAAYYSDKQWYQTHVNGSIRVQDLFPGQWVSYKLHCKDAGRLPNNARIVGFHGEPKPCAVNDLWVKEHWR